jgi:hypothetical protein
VGGYCSIAARRAKAGRILIFEFSILIFDFLLDLGQGMGRADFSLGAE